jgi:hypothetical protein
MYGSITNLPRLHNFNDAVEFYTKTKGIRGREHLKPLKSTRRDPDSYKITVDRNVDGSIREVNCWLYNTPVLVYTPTALIVNGYCSMTTNSFIDNIAPYWLRAYMKNNQQVFYVSGEGEFLADTDGELVVSVDENYKPIKGEVRAAKLNKIVLNRTRANEARKETKDVIALATLTSKIDGYWTALVNSDEIAPDEETAWLKGILKNGHYRVNKYNGWRNGEWCEYEGHTGFGQWGKHSAEDLLKYLKQQLYAAQYRRHECFDYSPAPYGVIPKEWEKAE